ncbi:MAG: hypothetical protein ACFE9Z_16225 [Promethearchaeota archaeon]
MSENRFITGTELFSKDFETKYLRLFKNLTLNIEPELKWVDKIFVFEDLHVETLRNYYSEVISQK